MTVSRKWESQVRGVMADIVATHRQRESAEKTAQHAFQHFEFNTNQGPVLEQTWRARAIRDIQRIATWYGWPGEITRALDAAGTQSLGSLDDAAVEALLTRMRQLEECVQTAGDAPDAPPAR